MKKKIILCSDGTGNKALKGRGTNVFKLYEAIERKETQLAFYDDGVGTEGFKPKRLLGGAFGLGLSRNVRELYAHLVRCYNPGDEIYLFGFSRGAFTVRTLAGFVLEFGILDRHQFESDGEMRQCVKGAYKAYRRKYKTWTSFIWSALFSGWSRLFNKYTDVDAIRKKTLEDGKAKIDFIGVWDTVSAVGFPYKVLADFVDRVIYKFKFPSNTLSDKVVKACHAVSIDDKRKTFHPEMWKKCSDNDDRIEQVWFAGVHANVGGGYPKQGMSLVSLAWMMKKAHAGGKGIDFNRHDMELYAKHADVHDKLYDSRAGVAIYYPYAPRDIFKICQDSGIKPYIHKTVYDRSIILTDAYAPGNLPSNMIFVDDDGIPVLEEETRVITENMGGVTSLLQKVKNWIRFRQWLQAIFILLTVAAIYLLYKAYPTQTLLDLINFEASFAVMFEVVVYLFGSIIVPLFIVYVLSRIARAKIGSVYSKFWYNINKRIGF
jgi:uncharacterized protein (DUF2235 family)